MERYSLLVVVILFVVFFLGRDRFLKRQPSETASGAVVMALGIFVNGAAYRLPLHQSWMQVYALGVFVVWLFVAASYVRAAWRREIKARHLKDPIHSFAMGTWVAGTSVCATAVTKNVPGWDGVTQVMAAVALSLWGYYIVMSVRNFWKLTSTELYRKAHGVILIATVSTQSLAIIYKTLYLDRIPDAVFAGVIVIGTCLYVWGFGLIACRYARSRSWTLRDDWPNTNCILHGSMSITGLASVATGAVSPNFTLAIWLWVLVWFVVVETLEIGRLISRIRTYGFVRGIGEYHVTEWSRNFTVGMLYTFTLFFDLSRTEWGGSVWLQAVKQAIENYGAWIVLALLINEILLFLHDKSVYRLSWLERRLAASAGGKQPRRGGGA